MTEPLSAEELRAQVEAERAKSGALSGNPTLTGGDRTTAPVSSLDVTPQEEALVGKNVVEDKNPEAIKADVSAAAGSPGRLPAQEENLSPSRTIQRPDGTITTADRQDETAHYIHGNRVMLRAGEKENIDALTADLNKMQDGRGISDIPVSDPFWEKKKELDAVVANLRR